MASTSPSDPFNTPEPGPADIQSWRQDADTAAAALKAAVSQMDTSLEGVRNGLPVNAVDVQASVQVAMERGEALRRHLSLSGVDPLPEWSSVDDLPATVDLLHETLVARRRTLRRSRLMALKSTLTSGSVTHRLQRRRNQLDGLRIKAVAELEALAGQETPPTLPGSIAGDAWLSWAWQLSPEQMDQLLDHLEAQFTALIAFLEQVEPDFWGGDLPAAEALPQQDSPAIEVDVEQIIDEDDEILEEGPDGLHLVDATRAEAAEAAPPQLVPSGTLPPLPQVDVDRK
ncbi:MAG: hypothetical protein ACE366_02295 [Bradymonadia bacterium]